MPFAQMRIDCRKGSRLDHIDHHRRCQDSDLAAANALGGVLGADDYFSFACQAGS